MIKLIKKHMFTSNKLSNTVVYVDFIIEHVPIWIVVIYVYDSKLLYSLEVKPGTGVFSN